MRWPWNKPERRVAVALREDWQNPSNADGEPGWSKLGGTGPRELDEGVLDAIRANAVEKYALNPYAKRGIEHFVNYVVGPGFQVRSWHPKFDEILQEHWEDPANNWDLRQFELVRDLSVLGESIPKAEVSDKLGRVRWSFVDPGRVHKIICEEDNAENVLHVILKKKVHEKRPKRLKAILPNEKRTKKGWVPLEGECFAFRVNRLRGQTRGQTDLAPVLDWLDVSDDFVFKAAERISDQQNVVWKYVMPGATQTEVEKKSAEIEPPERNSVEVTGDAEAGWQAVVPDIKAMDLKAADDVVLRRLEAGTGFPRHWFGEGTDTNRAVGAVMGAPVFRMLWARQRFVKYVLERMFDFVLSSAIEAGRVAPSETDEATGDVRDVDFEVVCPEITFEDQNPRTSALNSLIMALSLAKTDGAVTPEEYRSILLAQLDSDGYDLPEEIRTPDAPAAEAPANGDGLVAQLKALAASDNGRSTYLKMADRRY